MQHVAPQQACHCLLLGTALAEPVLRSMIAGRDSWMLREPTFAGLDLTERRVLMDWLAAERARGIDTAIDFARRPWGVPWIASELNCVIGVFKTGRLMASWLLVRYQAQWVVVTVAGETVSAVRDSLDEALELIQAPDLRQ